MVPFCSASPPARSLTWPHGATQPRGLHAGSTSDITAPATQYQGPSHSQLLHKARLFETISYKLCVSLGRPVCLRNDSMKFEPVRLPMQMCLRLGSRQKLPQPRCTYYTQHVLPFFSISILPQLHNDSKRKMK